MSQDLKQSLLYFQILLFDNLCLKLANQYFSPYANKFIQTNSTQLQPDQVQDLENNKHLANISSISALEVNTKVWPEEVIGILATLLLNFLSLEFPMKSIIYDKKNNFRIMTKL